LRDAWLGFQGARWWGWFESEGDLGGDGG
jgi:hypothetical protein